MATNIVSFQFGASTVRTLIDEQGNPWFVAKDVAIILGYRDAANAARLIDGDERGTHTLSTPGGTQSVTMINESGLYSLILTSRKPEAKRFKKWVTSEVLPSIRKTGSYAINQEPFDEKEKLKKLAELALAQLALLEELERKQIENQMLVEENETLSELVDELYDYSSIIRIAKFNKVHEKTFEWRKLKAASLQLGLEIKKAPDARYETKNLYHHQAWRTVYPSYKIPETLTMVVSNKNITYGN